ncbi:TPA: hypothetical protein ACU3BT_004518 [Salmonella enterica]
MLSVVRRKLSSIVDMQETVRQSSQMLESDAAIFLKRAIVARMLQKIKYQDSEVLKDCLGDFFIYEQREKLRRLGVITKEVAIKWSAAPDMTPQTVLYRRPVAQFSNFQPKIVSSWLILALFQANFLISGRSRLCPYQLVNSNQVRQGE